MTTSIFNVGGQCVGVQVIPVSTAVQCGVPSTMVISQSGQASGPSRLQCLVELTSEKRVF